jgi:enoyl-CoA hydratase
VGTKVFGGGVANVRQPGVTRTPFGRPRFDQPDEPSISMVETGPMSELVSYKIADQVAIISMDDGKANALSSAMIAAINGALDRALADDAVVVLTGRPGIFSGGFDLKILGAGGPPAAEMLEQGFLLSLRLLEHPAPVVIACPGHAVAMGFFLLLSADYRIGVNGPFKFVANEVAIGLTMPQAAIEICRQRLTPAHFTRAVMLAEPCGPAEAVNAGIVDRVVEVSELEATVASVGGGLAQLNRAAHSATKALAREASLVAIRDGLERDRRIFKALSAVSPSDR